MICIKPSNKFLIINNICLHILIIFILLTLLYFFYIRPLTIQGFNGIFEDSIKNIFTELKQNPKASQLKDIFKNYLKNINLNKYSNFVKSQPNELINDINSKLREQIIIVIFFLILIVLLLNILPPTVFKYCNGLGTVLIELFVVFIIVLFIEFMFFTNVAQKFIPVEPSFLNDYIKNKLINILQNNNIN